MAPAIKKQIEEHELNQPVEGVKAKCSNQFVSEFDPIIDSSKEMESKIQCTEKDKKEYALQCSDQFYCNGQRAILGASKVFPSFIKNKIQDKVKKSVFEKGLGKSCLDTNESDCLTEIWTGFVANIQDTAKSLWSLAKTGVSSLWNLKDYFNKKSDDLVISMNENKDDVISFWDSPSKWMDNKLTKLKNGVNDWLKSSVFCQKWEGTPHQSQCLKPLNNFDCLDCNDSANAFCVGLGALSSEGVMVFLTGGVSTLTTLGTKAGVKAMTRIAEKTAVHVAEVLPVLKRVQNVSKRGGKTSKLSRMASTVVKVSAEKINKAKDLAAQIINYASGTTVVALTAKATKIVTTPLRVVDNIAMKGANFADGFVAKFATKRVRVMAKRKLVARNSKLVEGGSTSVSNSFRMAIRKHTRGDREVGLAQKGAEHHANKKESSNNNNNNHEQQGSGSSNLEGQNQGSNNKKEKERLSENGGSHDGKSQSQEDQKRKDREKSDDSEQRKKKQTNASSKRVLAKKAKEAAIEGQLGRTAVAADIAAKSLAPKDQQGLQQEETQRLRKQLQQNGQNLSQANRISSMGDVKKALYNDPYSNVTSGEMYKRSNDLMEQYSDYNKEYMVNKMMKDGLVDRTKAEEYFNKRQKEVTEAHSILEDPRIKNSLAKLEKLKKKIKDNQGIKTNKPGKEVSSFSNVSSLPSKSGVGQSRSISSKMYGSGSSSGSASGMNSVSRGFINGPVGMSSDNSEEFDTSSFTGINHEDKKDGEKKKVVEENKKLKEKKEVDQELKKIALEMKLLMNIVDYSEKNNLNRVTRKWVNQPKIQEVLGHSMHGSFEMIEIPMKDRTVLAIRDDGGRDWVLENHNNEFSRLDGLDLKFLFE